MAETGLDGALHNQHNHQTIFLAHMIHSAYAFDNNTGLVARSLSFAVRAEKSKKQPLI